MNIHFKKDMYLLNKDTLNLIHIVSVDFATGNCCIVEFGQGFSMKQPIFLGELEKRVKKGLYSLDVPPMHLVLNDGSVVVVDTDHLFDNQYNIANKRVHDTAIKQVINDRRYLGWIKSDDSYNHDDSLSFVHWRGVKPEPINFLTQETADKEGLTLKTWHDGRASLYGLIGDYHIDLNTSTCGGYYYRASNHGRYGSFDFIYQDGVFYEVSHKIGYRKLKSLDGKVTKAVTKQLKYLFAKYHK